MLDIVASYHFIQFQGKLMTQISGPILGPLFSKIWLCQSLDIMVSYHHVQYQKKIMIQFWENLVTDGQTDRQADRLTDWQTDESDFIGCCPTDV